MTAHEKTAFVVIAEFTIKPGCLEQFLAIARQDARDSVANEPGCQQFDAVQPEGRSDQVVLYEVYDDRAAFDAHLQSEHYFPFRDGVPALTVGEPTVRFCTRVG
jgi:quinol monooxygenase YgiN